MNLHKWRLITAIIIVITVISIIVHTYNSYQANHKLEQSAQKIYEPLH
jgi:cell division protein FtsL